MIRHDVEKDVQAQNVNDVQNNTQFTKPIQMEDFIKL